MLKQENTQQFINYWEILVENFSQIEDTYSTLQFPWSENMLFIMYSLKSCNNIDRLMSNLPIISEIDIPFVWDTVP